jgi:hypothetical protein
MINIPRDIHRAIGMLLDHVGQQDLDAEPMDQELEDAWNLVGEWWEAMPVEDRDSGIDPYPPGATGPC